MLFFLPYLYVVVLVPNKMSVVQYEHIVLNLQWLNVSPFNRNQCLR